MFSNQSKLTIVITRKDAAKKLLKILNKVRFNAISRLKHCEKENRKYIGANVEVFLSGAIDALNGTIKIIDEEIEKFLKWQNIKNQND